MPHHLLMPDTSMTRFTEGIAFAQSHETPWPRDPAADPARWGVHHNDPPPFNRLRGPVHVRGGVSGAIRIRGAEGAAWGHPHPPDQPHPAPTTYLPPPPGIAQPHRRP